MSLLILYGGFHIQLIKKQSKNQIKVLLICKNDIIAYKYLIGFL